MVILRFQKAAYNKGKDYIVIKMFNYKKKQIISFWYSPDKTWVLVFFLFFKIQKMGIKPNKFLVVSMFLQNNKLFLKIGSFMKKKKFWRTI